MLILLLKTPRILVVGYREFNLELTRKLSLLWLVLEGATGCGGRKHTNGLIQGWILHATILTCQARCAYWFNQ